MFVRQGVQIWLKVVPVLSAEIGDNFCHGHLIESGKAAKKDYFLNKLIGERCQDRIEKSRLVSKSTFWVCAPDFLYHKLLINNTIFHKFRIMPIMLNARRYLFYKFSWLCCIKILKIELS